MLISVRSGEKWRRLSDCLRKSYPWKMKTMKGICGLSISLSRWFKEKPTTLNKLISYLLVGKKYQKPIMSFLKSSKIYRIGFLNYDDHCKSINIEEYSMLKWLVTILILLLYGDYCLSINMPKLLECSPSTSVN